ncbi:MAG: leishmanolysin-related zinc metalloendopeptidase [Bryobacteraceae bacterium]
MAKKKTPPASKVETYFSHASVKRATAAAIQSAYNIEVRFLGGLTTTQKNAFKKAADRWSKAIVGDLPSVMIDGDVIDDLLIVAQGVSIDGPGRILGQAGPTHLRPARAGASAFLPAKGLMSFDTADLAKMQADGTLVDVIAHEMGHVIGIGTIWELKRLLVGAGSNNPTFRGVHAKREYGVLKDRRPLSVPVENTGGSGTRDGHWRETVFRNELMSGFIAASGNPLSKMTVASLQDLGYTVDLSAGEPYELPDLMALAETGRLRSLQDVPHPHALPIFAPRVLPDDRLVP